MKSLYSKSKPKLFLVAPDHGNRRYDVAWSVANTGISRYGPWKVFCRRKLFDYESLFESPLRPCRFLFIVYSYTDTINSERQTASHWQSETLGFQHKSLGMGTWVCELGDRQP